MSDLSTTLPAQMMAPVNSLMGDLRQTEKAMGDVDKAAEAAYAEKTKALQGETDELKRQQADVKKFTEEHPFPHPDIKPWTQKAPEPDPMKAFGSWASAFGILAGAITKTGLTSSLNASAAAINAFRKNDMDAYEDAKQAWKDNTEIAIKNADWEAKGYDAAFKLMETDHAQGMAMALNVAAQADNQIALQAFKTNNLTKAFEIKKGLAEFAAQGPERVARMQQLAFQMEDQKDRYELFTKWKLQHPDAKPEDEALARTQILSPQFTINQARALAEGGGAAAGPAGGGQLSDEAIYDQAVLYNSGADVKIPRQGKANQVTWNKMLNKAAELRREQGRSIGQMVVDRKELHSQGLALDALIKQKAALEPFEKNAIANAKVLQELAKKVDTTGIPVLERYLRAGAQAITGDQDVTNFHAQLGVFLPEVAKILNNPNLSGILSDSAREEAQGLIPAGTTAKQLAGLIPLLEGDFKRRAESIEGEIDATKQNIKTLADFDNEKRPDSSKSTADVGSQDNPISVTNDDDYAKAPKGSYVKTPDGQVRGPKP